jgi:hypothetical protein
VRRVSLSTAAIITVPTGATMPVFKQQFTPWNKLAFSPSTAGRWGHDFVQAQFAGQLVNRRKLYPRELHEALVRNYILRQVADYQWDVVSETQAGRALRRTREFLATIQRGGESV